MKINVYTFNRSDSAVFIFALNIDKSLILRKECAEQIVFIFAMSQSASMHFNVLKACRNSNISLSSQSFNISSCKQFIKLFRSPKADAKSGESVKIFPV